jgi:hypothetical protein
MRLSYWLFSVNKWEAVTNYSAANMVLSKCLHLQERIAEANSDLQEASNPCEARDIRERAARFAWCIHLDALPHLFFGKISEDDVRRFIQQTLGDPLKQKFLLTAGSSGKRLFYNLDVVHDNRIPYLFPTSRTRMVVDGKPVGLRNQRDLQLAAMQKQFRSPLWLTAKGAAALGVSIKPEELDNGIIIGEFAKEFVLRNGKIQRVQTVSERNEHTASSSEVEYYNILDVDIRFLQKHWNKDQQALWMPPAAQGGPSPAVTNDSFLRALMHNCGASEARSNEHFTVWFAKSIGKGKMSYYVRVNRVTKYRRDFAKRAGDSPPSRFWIRATDVTLEGLKLRTDGHSPTVVRVSVASSAGMTTAEAGKAYRVVYNSQQTTDPVRVVGLTRLLASNHTVL